MTIDASREAAEVRKILTGIPAVLQAGRDSRVVAAIIDEAYNRTVPELEVNEGQMPARRRRKRGLDRLPDRVQEEYYTLMAVARRPEECVPRPRRPFLSEAYARMLHTMQPGARNLGIR